MVCRRSQLPPAPQQGASWSREDELIASCTPFGPAVPGRTEYARRPAQRGELLAEGEVFESAISAGTRRGAQHTEEIQE
jgi:hypothetical protein